MIFHLIYYGLFIKNCSVLTLKTKLHNSLLKSTQKQNFRGFLHHLMPSFRYTIYCIFLVYMDKINYCKNKYFETYRLGNQKWFFYCIAVKNLLTTFISESVSVGFHLQMFNKEIKVKQKKKLKIFTFAIILSNKRFQNDKYRSNTVRNTKAAGDCICL